MGLCQPSFFSSFFLHIFSLSFENKQINKHSSKLKENRLVALENQEQRWTDIFDQLQLQGLRAISTPGDDGLVPSFSSSLARRPWSAASLNKGSSRPNLVRVADPSPARPACPDAPPRQYSGQKLETLLSLPPGTAFASSRELQFAVLLRCHWPDSSTFVLQAAHCADAISDFISPLPRGELAIDVFGEVASSYQHPFADRPAAVQASCATSPVFPGTPALPRRSVTPSSSVRGPLRGALIAHDETMIPHKSRRNLVQEDC